MKSILKKIQFILAVSAMVIVLGGAKCSKNDPVAQHVSIDPSLLVACPALPVIDTATITMGQLLTDHEELQKQYIECAIRHDCLIEATRDSTVITCPKLDKIKTP